MAQTRFIMNATTSVLVLLTWASIALAETVVVTVAAPIPSNEPSFSKDATFTSAILNSTNFYRGEHNASDVTWNDTLADFASDYLADNDDCVFEHSGGPYGENLAIGYPNATASIEAWGDERDEYDFKHPDFTHETGHFTQLVWKDTTDVGCDRKLCGHSGWYLVCEYWPRGNVIGQFADEVDRESRAAATLPNACTAMTVALIAYLL